MMSLKEYLPYHHQQLRKLDEIAQILEPLKLLELIMSQNDDLKAAVAAQTTVIASATTLLDGLATRLQAALDKINAGEGTDDLTSVIHDVMSNTSGLAAAVARDTVADGELSNGGGSATTPPPDDTNGTSGLPTGTTTPPAGEGSTAAPAPAPAPAPTPAPAPAEGATPSGDDTVAATPPDSAAGSDTVAGS